MAADPSFGARGYNIGKVRGREARGKAASMPAISASERRSRAAPAFSSTCSGVEAFGMANSEGRRLRNASATCRGVA